MDKFQIITALVAIYGALLSTYMAVSRYREKKHRVKVELRIVLHRSNNPPSISEALTITAINPGNRRVTLRSPIILASKKEFGLVLQLQAQSDVAFPHDLLDGKSCSVWMDLYDIIQDLRRRNITGIIKFHGSYTDALNKTYESNPLIIDIDEWYKTRFTTNS